MLTLSQVKEIREQAERATTPDQMGIIGPGKALYEQYRNGWSVYKHPQPEWNAIGWEAMHVWNKVAIAASRTNVPALCELVKVLMDALSIECGSHNVRATDSRDADVKPLCKCPRCALLRQLRREEL